MMSTNRALPLSAVLVATFMGQFDFFVVNVAAPSLRRDLGASSAQLELVIAAYAVTYAAGLITGGRLGDLFGRRRVFMLGLAAFAVTSAVCGLAPGVGSLIVGRSLQGLAAAVMLPQVLAFITTWFPAARRSWAMGWFGVASGLGSISGQALGGWLVQSSPWGLGWRSVFLINLPVMVVALVAAYALLPADGGRGTASRRRVDGVGAVGLFAGMGLVVTAITVAQLGHLLPCVAAALGGVGFLAVTLAFEGRRGRTGSVVTIDPSLFRKRSVRVGAIASGAFMAYFGSFMFVLTVTLQDISGLDALHAGLVFLPSGLTFMVSSLAASAFGPRPRTRLLIGCAVTLTGLVIAVTGAVAAGSPEALPTWLAVAVAITGLGNGLVLPALIGVAMRDIAPADAGMASGAVTTIQQFAAAVGVAGLGAVFFAMGAGIPALTSAIAVHIVLLLAVAVACAKVPTDEAPQTSPLGAPTSRLTSSTEKRCPDQTR